MGEARTGIPALALAWGGAGLLKKLLVLELTLLGVEGVSTVAGDPAPVWCAHGELFTGGVGHARLLLLLLLVFGTWPVACGCDVG